MSEQTPKANARLAKAVRAAPTQLLGGTVSLASSRMAWSTTGLVVPFCGRKPGRRRGGEADPADPGRGGARSANARVYLTAFPNPGQVGAEKARGGTIATADPCDRAHAVRDAADGNLLAPAAELGPDQATPRRYPPGHFNARGVAIDSSFDALYERLRWLEREVGDIAGMGVASASSNQREAAMGLALKRSAERRRR